MHQAHFVKDLFSEYLSIWENVHGCRLLAFSSFFVNFFVIFLSCDQFICLLQCHTYSLSSFSFYLLSGPSAVFGGRREKRLRAQEVMIRTCVRSRTSQAKGNATDQSSKPRSIQALEFVSLDMKQTKLLSSTYCVGQRIRQMLVSGPNLARPYSLS